MLLQNPDYMHEKFIIKIESIHLPDSGTTENVGYMFIMLLTVCVCVIRNIVIVVFPLKTTK